MKFKVIAAKGVTLNGKHHEKGATLTGERYNGQISTALHFGQIKPIAEEKESDPDAEAKAQAEKAEADAKAKAEADAKAKADAEAKAAKK